MTRFQNVLLVFLFNVFFQSSAFSIVAPASFRPMDIRCQEEGQGFGAIQAVYRTVVEPTQNIILAKSSPARCHSQLATSADRLIIEIQNVSAAHGSVGFQDWAVNGSLDGWETDDWSCGIMSCPLGRALERSRNLAALQGTCGESACQRSLGEYSRQICREFTSLRQTQYKNFMIRYRGLRNIQRIFLNNR